MAPLKQTAFRLTDADLAILDEAREQSGTLSRAEALRIVLRFWADQHEPRRVQRKAKPKRRRK